MFCVVVVVVTSRLVAAAADGGIRSSDHASLFFQPTSFLHLFSKTPYLFLDIAKQQQFHFASFVHTNATFFTPRSLLSKYCFDSACHQIENVCSATKLQLITASQMMLLPWRAP